MRLHHAQVLAVAGFMIAAATLPRAAAIQTTTGTRVVLTLTSDTSTAEQRDAAAQIESWIASSRLRRIDRREDPLVPGRVHERYQQVSGAIPVLGADVTVQRAGSQIVSAAGIVFDGLSIDAAATLSFGQVSTALAASGLSLIDSAAPLAILPMSEGGVELVYTVRGTDGFITYVSAHDASVKFRIDAIQTQSAVLTGTGALGDAKKISATAQGGSFVALDGLRPPALETFDLQGDLARAISLANGRSTVNSTDLARQSGEVWTDSAVVDAHVHAGWVYDYYYRRFQRRGLDNNDVRIHSVVHPVRLQDARNAPSNVLNQLFVNAFYSTLCRCMVYGEGLPAGLFATFPNGVRNFATALDVVAHEMTHGVTDNTSRLIYANESGALNEAFSDIMGASVEFFHQPAGTGTLRADYLIGEDLASGTTALQRSMSAPATSGQPDHFWFRRGVGSRLLDSGGVHINSGIANHAFFLAIEGGTHAFSRRVVQGVGAANREQIEKVFYRAFTTMLPSASTFYLARLGTLQSARDLYGTGSAVERAIGEAWDAVGVTSPASALTTQFTPPSVSPSNAACGGVAPSFTFRISVSEFQRVGFTVAGFNAYSFNSNGVQIGPPERFSDATFRAWFNECQAASTRIAGGATACATLCGHLGGRREGYAQFVFFGADDNGNSGAFDSDPVSLGVPALGEAATELTSPAFTKAVRR